MILLTQYGREVVWSIAIILLFIIGGWTGKKTAVVMGLAMLVLIPVVNAAKEIVAPDRFVNCSRFKIFLSIRPRYDSVCWCSGSLNVI
jgi:hypothetical protein